MIVRWRNGEGVIVPEDLEIPQYDLSQVVSKDEKGIYNTGLQKCFFLLSKAFFDFILVNVEDKEYSNFMVYQRSSVHKCSFNMSFILLEVTGAQFIALFIFWYARQI